MGIDWFMLIIPAIAIGIWAFRNIMEKNNEAARNLPPQARQPAQRQRSATAEIDRFLEEVNRRRQMQQQRQTQARRMEEPVTVVEAVEVAPPPVVPRARPVAPAPPPPQRSRPIASSTRRRSIAQPEIVVAALAQPQVMDALPARPAGRLDVPIAIPVNRPLPQHLQQLRNLLQTPSGLRTAIILNELFGAPRCRRRHGRT